MARVGIPLLPRQRHLARKRLGLHQITLVKTRKVKFVQGGRSGVTEQKNSKDFLLQSVKRGIKGNGNIEIDIEWNILE